MFPQLGNVTLGWGVPVQMKIISKVPQNFEVDSVTTLITELDMMLTAMSPRKVDRKPEGERTWKWWDGLTTSKVLKDTVMQDPDGLVFRVDSTKDWSQAGFWLCDLVQQPNGNF